MDAARLRAVARRWWWLIMLGGFIAVAAYGVAWRVRESRHGPPEYRAQATLYIVPSAVQDDVNGVSASIQRSYALLITGPDVAGAAVGRVTAEAVPGTQLIEVAARGRTAAEADELLSAVLITFARQRPQQELTGDVLVYDRIPPAPIPSDATPLSLALALVTLAGLSGAAAMVIAYERFALIVRTAEDAEIAVGAPVLAAVPSEAALVVHDPAEASRGAERYRLLRTNVRVTAGGEHPRSVLFVSPRSNGPAASVAANYAVALAQSGRRVALLEADLRAPVLHEFFGTPSQVGLVEALSEGLALDTAAMPTTPAVALITAGGQPSDASELLDSARFAALFAELRERFDAVVLDCAPALDASDAAIVASQCDATALVLGQETPRAEAEEAARVLRVAGAQILGAVMVADRRLRWRAPFLTSGRLPAVAEAPQ